MKQITINPLYKKNPDDFPQVSFLVDGDENYAISSDGFYISLVEVLPVPDHPGEYLPTQIGNYVNVAVDDHRTIAGLNGVVDRLRSMSAYELLTRHHNLFWETFYINRNKEFAAGIEEDEDRVNPLEPHPGRDY